MAGSVGDAVIGVRGAVVKKLSYFNVGGGGGCSLFGGKGKPVNAVIGGLVVAVIDNGMSLLNQPSGRVFMVTGLVLLIAASVDALSRRRAAASGRA